ncbi:MAG: N-acetyltransferase [Bacteroidales bacterium]|nr:N-acetyltransferase [Bacteroidales bacterium]
MNEEKQGYYAHPTAEIDEGCTIGNGTRIWHFCHLMTGCLIGKDCNLGQNVFVARGVVLGNNVKVQNNVSLYTGVECEDDVFLGPSMVFTNVINPRSAVIRRDEYARTLVRRGATIGANATVICGNEIGEWAFVAAGAVVTRPVPAFALVMGSPARQTGWMSAHGHRLEFGPDDRARCPGSGEWYIMENGMVRKEA